MMDWLIGPHLYKVFLAALTGRTNAVLKKGDCFCQKASSSAGQKRRSSCVHARNGSMLSPAASARSNTSSKAGASATAHDAAGHARPAADRAVARCTATESCVHQRRAEAVAAAWRSASGARSLRRRTSSRTRARAPVPQRPPTSEPSTTRRWGPLRSSSGFKACGIFVLRSILAAAAPTKTRAPCCGTL